MAGTMDPRAPQPPAGGRCLNGVRPRWPEQLGELVWLIGGAVSLNGVRPRWPEQFGIPKMQAILVDKSQWSPA